jgi:serine/threonine-protein kinase
VSFWERVKRGLGVGREAPAKEPEGSEREAPESAGPREDEAPEAQASPAEEARSKESADIERLGRVGQDGGPGADEAIAILRRVRGTVHEHAAAAKILEAIGERAVPEPVRVSCADILAARGDEAGALRVLEGARSTPALVLAADLFAATGQLARAVGTIERVLARAIDAPGARERQRRWSAALGVAKTEERRRDEATVVTATPQGAPFRLLREVARGGAGSVYEAEDELLGRRVAFKVYHGKSADRALLAREAKLASALAGPGVLRVFDADPSEGWLSIEWVPRGSVRDLLRSGQVSALAPLGPWAVSLARAIARVHEQGYVHADVKPANVLLRRPDEAVLGDFGIAQAIGAPGSPGSAGYVSPERIAGRPSDPRDDVYGFGRILEDVLHRFEEGAAAQPELVKDGHEIAVWRTIAELCIGPDETRPADGRALLGVIASIGRG